MRRIFACLGSAWFLLGANAQAAFTITFDYTYDKDANQVAFFSNNSKAKETLEKAASDLSAALNSIAFASLNAVNTTTFAGSDPALTITATFDWHLKVGNPTDPDPATPLIINDFKVNADTFTIFVGSSTNLGGIDALGEGAPASGTADLEYFDDPASAAAIQTAVNYSNGVLLRGAGPLITSIDDSVPLTSQGTVNYTLNLGALASFLTFDRTQSWQFDYAQPVGAGQFDFYTVMLHEMIHGLGVGTSKTWKSKVSGADWSGSHVSALKGSGIGLINETLNGKPDGSHIAAGTMSKTVEGNADQEAVMTATLVAGKRRFLTTLDVAFLRDLGFGPATAAPTPPPLPVPATPTPTPLVVTTLSAPPNAPVLAGKAKFSTTKSKVKLKGILSSPDAYVQYKVGSGPFLKAKGGKNWNFSVALKPGKNTITIVAYDPTSKKMSKATKVVIKRAAS